MRPWTAVEAMLLTLLLVGAVVVMWYGTLFIVFGVRWGELGGGLLLAGGFRAVVLFLDTVWRRPPQFSKRPWERRWEKEEQDCC